MQLYPLETAIGEPVYNLLHINPGSAAERTVKVLEDNGTKVVAAFNISNSDLGNIPEHIDCDCLICGDDEEAKKLTIELIEKIPDLKAIDIGKLSKAHLIELQYYSLD